VAMPVSVGRPTSNPSTMPWTPIPSMPAKSGRSPSDDTNHQPSNMGSRIAPDNPQPTIEKE
jgi:hypothetical protein